LDVWDKRVGGVHNGILSRATFLMDGALRHWIIESRRQGTLRAVDAEFVIHVEGDVA
jgi:hypothetical protein